METLPSHSGLYKKDILGNRPPNPRYKLKDWNISCGMNYTSKFTLQFKLGCFCVYCMRVCATGPQFKLGCLCVYCMCVCVCHRPPVQVGVFVCVLCYVCAVQIAALRSTQAHKTLLQPRGPSVNFISHGLQQSPAHYQQSAQW